ncbi:MAG: hypothetical protein K6U80_15525 [Firmicutes bacterium]|nr:hypothetical protein [Bacillota bacterium]
MAGIKFEIVQRLLELSQGSKGWAKEVNLVSWNDRKPKVDIREWDEAHEKMCKGITLNKEELQKLKEYLQNLDIDKLGLD